MSYYATYAGGQANTGKDYLAQALDSDRVDVGDPVVCVEVGSRGFYTAVFASVTGVAFIKFYEDGNEAAAEGIPVNPAAAGGGASAEELLAADVDSTGIGLTVAKALEVAVAAAMGNMAYDAETSTYTFYGRDGVTPIHSVVAAGNLTRSDSTIN